MAATVATIQRVQVRGGRLTFEAEDGARTAVAGPEPILAGRDSRCHLVVDDPGVSAVHAELVASERGVRVRDLGSKNGTWIGDVRITDAHLTGSTSLWLGKTEVLFEVISPEVVTLPEIDHFGSLWGQSARMRELFGRLARAAPTDLTVLIEGETGTGKELVAQSVHHASGRKDGPFVVVDCGGIAPSLAEATLFGHEKGAFTGADTARRSPFLEASGGTLFLDELGELPLEVQPKLLRALAERRVQPVGGSGYLPFDTRVIAATRRDLEKLVNGGGFRSDLYFRLAQVRVAVPPLRARLEDVPGLIRYMLGELGAKGAFRRVSRGSLERLLHYDWPGNVRELRNAVAVTLALAEEGAPLDIAAQVGLKASPAKGKHIAAPLVRDYHDAKREALHQFERVYFAALVQATGGNVAEISRRTGLQRTHVRRYLMLHGLREAGDLRVKT